MIQCFTNEAAIREPATSLREFMIEMGTTPNQGAVACVLDKIMYQIKFPFKGD